MSLRARTLAACFALFVLPSCAETSTFDPDLSPDRFETPADREKIDWGKCQKQNDLPAIVHDPANFVHKPHYGYFNPPLMAIGDSLYNGTNSLRQNRYGAEYSVPALVAMRQALIEIRNSKDANGTSSGGWDRNGKRRFYVPAYPECDNSATNPECNYGFNIQKLGDPVEDLITKFDDFLGFDDPLASEIANAQNALVKQTPINNNRLMVDNLAIASTRVENLYPNDYEIPGGYGLTAKKSRQHYWDSPRFDSRASPSTKNMADWLSDSFLLANSRFVLNPQNAPCLDDLTPLEQVLLRQPKKLLVNIGSNNGLWWMATHGEIIKSSDLRQCKDNATHYPYPGDGCGLSAQSSANNDLKLAEKHLEHLIDLLDKGYGRYKGLHEKSNGKEDQQVFINGLLEPRYAANITPIASSGFADGYYRQYNIEVWAKPGDAILTGLELKARDNAITEYNDNLKAYIKKKNEKANRRKFVFIDVDGILAGIDCKNKSPGDRAKSSCGMTLNISSDGGAGCFNILETEKRLTDEPITVHPNFLWNSWRILNGGPVDTGGLFSFDNMHLSMEGYALLAYCVDKVITWKPSGTNAGKKPLEECLKEAQRGDFKPLTLTYPDGTVSDGATITNPNQFYCQKSLHEYDSNFNTDDLHQQWLMKIGRSMITFD